MPTHVGINLVLKIKIRDNPGFVTETSIWTNRFSQSHHSFSFIIINFSPFFNSLYCQCIVSLADVKSETAFSCVIKVPEIFF